MSTAVNPATSSSGASSDTASATAANNQLSKDTFLKLLVAQIKYQNPLDPADGVEFLSQLAQFSELEQLMEIREEIAGFRKEVAPPETT